MLPKRLPCVSLAQLFLAAADQLRAKTSSKLSYHALRAQAVYSHYTPLNYKYIKKNLYNKIIP